MPWLLMHAAQQRAAADVRRRTRLSADVGREGPMDIPIHEWLNEREYARWICPHMSTFLTVLENHGNGIKAVGLANYRTPEAVVFLKLPLLETVVAAAARDTALKLRYDGIGQLHAVACPEHYVSARFAERPA
jgi:hypothetical protein